ncbi:MAG: DUF4258 domain-containing protein [Candidatus Levybacteria bacterium]|nr:DUF4258 domain-containing protein [Candidatus Levybacteria bacterium]MBI2420950.1 DUF4258 domain-containing protein [Candidatus Levybacteria bacterium]
MPVVFSDHAKDQLRRRRISKELVLETIQKPNEIDSSFKERKLRRRMIGGKILEIVTKTEGNKNEN